MGWVVGTSVWFAELFGTEWLWGRFNELQVVGDN